MALGCLFSAPAAASDARHRIVYQNFTVLRVNPLGVQNQFEIGYQYKLYDSDSILFRTGHARVYLAPTITPALVRLGVGALVEPLAVLKLGVKWEWLQYFGTFDHLQTFADVNADYSDTAIAANGDAGQNGVGGGYQLTLHAELRGKVGPVVLRSTFQALYTEMSGQNAGHKVWYDPYFDILAPTSGWVLINDADLLVFLLNDKLILGVRHNVTHAVYGDEAWARAPDGSSDIDDTPTQRLGPLVAYRFFDEPGLAWNRPTAVLLVNWYLVHPNRTGRDVHQAIPYVAVGFAFSGDLL